MEIVKYFFLAIPLILLYGSFRIFLILLNPNKLEKFKKQFENSEDGQSMAYFYPLFIAFMGTWAIIAAVYILRTLPTIISEF